MLLLFNEDLLYVKVGKDILCNLGLLNIVKMMDLLDFVQMIEVVICVLIVVSD